MMIKKAFTLIELVIVILILWILFGILGFLSWSYVYKLNLQNDQETILNTFFYVQTMSLSQPVYKNIPVSYVWVKLIPEKKYLLIMGNTWDLNQPSFAMDVKNLSYLKFWTGFDVEGNIFSTQGTFFYKPYKLGAYFVVNDGGNTKIFSGNTTVKFKFFDKDRKFCFQINLSSWRLMPVKCD